MTPRVVWKYAVPLAIGVTIPIPQGATLRHFAEVEGALWLWAQVDPSAPLEERVFEIHGTGHVFDADGLVFVGTATTQAGYVWHLYEVER